MFREIEITEMAGVRIGQCEDAEAGTGCTVILPDRPAPTGIDVRGGGPASREIELLRPLSAAQEIHGVLLSGGSAFGLGAANGVMQYLAERNIGVQVGRVVVPLVCQSDIFDLAVSRADVWPGPEMAYRACQAAEQGNYRDGNFGAGTGATIGKFMGMEHCMKSGIGSYAVTDGDLQLGAIVVVNALGDVYNHRTGRQIAGLLAEDRCVLRSTCQEMAQMPQTINGHQGANTTIGIVLTNARFDKSQLSKIAGMSQNGLARTIRPVHTSMDGDGLYAMSLGNCSANIDLIGTMAADVVCMSVLRAVSAAHSAYGFPSMQELFPGRV